MTSQLSEDLAALDARAILRKQLDASIEAIDRARFHIATANDMRFTRLSRIVRRMVRLSYLWHARGNDSWARRWWHEAERRSLFCGGYSGPLPYTHDGYGAIQLQDGFSAHSPVPMRVPDPRDPDYSREGIFQTHNCYRCRHGAKACVHGNPRRCGNLHARNG